MRIFSKIFLGILCLAILAGTHFLDYRLQAKQSEPEVPVLRLSDGSEKSPKPDGSYDFKASEKPLTLYFKERSFFTLAPKASVTLKFSERKMDVTLLSGRIWLNTLSSPFDADITVGQMKLSVPPGVFDLEFEKGVLKAAAHRHEFRLQFLSQTLLVPEKRKIEISESKLTKNAETLKKLQYSKLVKEFPTEPLVAADGWVQANEKEDAKFAQTLMKKTEDEIREEGMNLPESDDSAVFRANLWIRDASQFFTYDPKKKHTQKVSAVSAYFDDAAYAALIGDTDLMKRRLAAFTSQARDFSSEPAFLDRLTKFSVFSPQEKFFDAKLALREAVFGTPGEKLRMRWRDVLDAASDGSGQTGTERIVTVLRRFGIIADSQAPKLKDSDAFFFALEVSDFLNRDSRFLREEFLRIADIFENAHLAQVADRKQQDEERQFFMMGKLQLAARINSALQGGDIPFQEGRSSLLFVVNQIEALRPELSDAAVIKHFDEQFAKIRPIITFLRAPEAQRLHGSFQESFDDFQTRQEEFKQVSKLLETSTGGDQIPPDRREELVALVTEQLESLELENLKITLPELPDDTTVKILNAEIQGKPFTAVYDTDRKIFSKITIGGEEIPNAVRLANFKDFFLLKIGKLVLSDGKKAEELVEKPTEATLLEKISKTRLLEDLQKLGVQVADGNLGLQDLEKDVIHVKLALLGEGSRAIAFSFDATKKASYVENLKIATIAGEIPVNESFVLRELPTRVSQVYKRSLLDIEKEEDLKKFLEEEISG